MATAGAVATLHFGDGATGREATGSVTRSQASGMGRAADTAVLAGAVYDSTADGLCTRATVFAGGWSPLFCPEKTGSEPTINNQIPPMVYSAITTCVFAWGLKLGPRPSTWWSSQNCGNTNVDATESSATTDSTGVVYEDDATPRRSTQVAISK